MNLVDKAYMIVKAAHSAQTRDNGEMYYHHLVRVVEILRRNGIQNDITLTVAMLHDIIEDTHWSYHDVKQEFGGVVADLVAHVSDDTRLPSVERFADTLAHVKEMPVVSALVKVADMIDNVGDMSCWKPKRRQKYLDKKEKVLNEIKKGPLKDYLDHAILEELNCLIQKRREDDAVKKA